MESYVDYCKQYIADHIGGYEGQSVFGSDFCYEITSESNANGTCTFSRHEAVEYLRKWWYDAADYYDYCASEWGTVMNPFANPEAYMVGMLIYGCNALLSNAPHINENWNDVFELTPGVIDDIVKHVESQSLITF